MWPSTWNILHLRICRVWTLVLFITNLPIKISHIRPVEDEWNGQLILCMAWENSFRGTPRFLPNVGMWRNWRGHRTGRWWVTAEKLPLLRSRLMNIHALFKDRGYHGTRTVHRRRTLYQSMTNMYVSTSLISDTVSLYCCPSCFVLFNFQCHRNVFSAARSVLTTVTSV